MADAQLKKLVAQNDQLRDELKFAGTICSASEACKDLKSYCDSTKDPLLPDFAGENPFILGQGGGGGGGGCEIL
eukprot:CAMPEP_0201491810 /NCGR_PEP_ID=MMETSP0151_2-20130828/31323_1 /ASSEMBLY_ACC=CAM_ASM_000257 /TAXON_ID=200890 /ORGANISM="Paramoeba atlantica, Strain 621/1 / CCAP 1560/9" /LENGTH=73 /DNA_ID=CAMNT_0047878343 /DNA_START=19 /DNA_END=240 /DNA_ORIENTATION=+